MLYCLVHHIEKIATGAASGLKGKLPAAMQPACAH